MQEVSPLITASLTQLWELAGAIESVGFDFEYVIWWITVQKTHLIHPTIKIQNLHFQSHPELAMA